MPVLHNRISNEELKARMLAETEPRTTVSFYKYFSIDDPKAFRDSLYVQFEKLKVFGRIYVAKEGINAQISVPQHHFDAFKAALFASHPALDQVRLNIALEDDGKSFWVLRLKVRERIVADGIDDESFDPSNVGEYLQADRVSNSPMPTDSKFFTTSASRSACGMSGKQSSRLRWAIATRRLRKRMENRPIEVPSQ